MADLVKWMQNNGVTNPHAVPDKLQDEFKALFPPDKFKLIWPQPGGQEDFLNCTADIAFYGGEAGAGKSWCLAYEHMKWRNIIGYEGALVRKTFRQMFKPGGLWTNAGSVFKEFGGKPHQGAQPMYSFGNKSKVFFMHSQHASKVDDYWQGIEVPYIGIDEVTQFQKSEFLYITSRLRSMTGIDAYLRATCNPDPDSWVREMIDWWIDEEGYIIPDRCGIIRYYVHRDSKFIWADSRKELIERFGEGTNPISFTFIRGHLKDNKVLLDKDPSYKSKLENLEEDQKKSLSDGNWNHYEKEGSLFSHKNFNQHRVNESDVPDLRKVVIGIDPAGSTSDSSDDTGIVGSGRGTDGHCYPLDDRTGKYHPNDWARVAVEMFDDLEADYIVAESNYGGEMVQNTIDMYCKSIGRSDIRVKMVPASRGKIVRAQPIATLYRQGKVHHVGHEKLKKLESEMVSCFVENEKPPHSPNRGDALVWTITELAVNNKSRVPRVGRVS